MNSRTTFASIVSILTCLGLASCTTPTNDPNLSFGAGITTLMLENETGKFSPGPQLKDPGQRCVIVFAIEAPPELGETNALKFSARTYPVGLMIKHEVFEWNVTRSEAVNGVKEVFGDRKVIFKAFAIPANQTWHVDKVKLGSRSQEAFRVYEVACKPKETNSEQSVIGTLLTIELKGDSRIVFSWKDAGRSFTLPESVSGEIRKAYLTEKE